MIIAGSVSNEEAEKTYPDGWESPRPYIRIVPQPAELAVHAATQVGSGGDEPDPLRELERQIELGALFSARRR